MIFGKGSIRCNIEMDLNKFDVVLAAKAVAVRALLRFCLLVTSSSVASFASLEDCQVFVSMCFLMHKESS